jgi:tyrosyl-tRNA synthetase
MGTSKGEGIVVKNMTKLNKADKLFYLKLVDVEYQETNSCREIIKTINDEKLIKADETALLDLMVTAKLIPSKGEGRRLIQQGGVSVDDVKITEPNHTIAKDALVNGIVVKKGKKVFHKIIAK